MSRLCDLSIAEAAAGLRTHEFSPTDLLEDCFRRIEETDGRIKAWTFLNSIAARRRASELEERWEEVQTAGPLWGIPLGIKDIIDVEGMPTTASSKVLEGNVRLSDAPVVKRLRDAGAILLGKTNTHEFAYGVVSPPTTNPWDPAFIPGGSSGGSAAAVAAGQCFAALGSDTAGSIRIPSSFCGVAGLKPSRGALPMEGVIPLAPSYDVVGPIARTPEDLSLVWSVLFGEDLEYHRRRLMSPDEGIRIAIPEISDMPVFDPEVQSAYERAVEILSSMAADTVQVRVPHYYELDLPRGLVLMVEALEVHRLQLGTWPEKADLYTDETRSYLEYAQRWFRMGLPYPGPDPVSFLLQMTAYPNYEPALNLARDIGRRIVEHLDDADVLIAPTVPRLAPTHEEAAIIDEGSPRRPIVSELTRMPAVANVTGLAAVSIPCGYSTSGLPIGLQLMGRDEGPLLHLATEFERETRWTDRRPPLIT